MMSRLSRQDLLRRAAEIIERSRPVIVAREPHWWSDAAQRELEAFRAGGPLPTSREALELLAIDIELEESV